MDISWNGTELTVGNGARFTAPFSAASAGDIGAPPADGYDRTSFTPQPGTAVHILVPSASGDQIFTLWIPPNQQLAGGSSPLLLDWRLAGASPPPAVGGAFPKAFEEINLAGDLFAGGAGVAATNLMVTVAILLLLLAGGAVFNEALEENVRGWGVRTVRVPGALGGVFSQVRGALLGVGAAWAALIPGRSWLDHAIGPAALLLGTGLIYSMLEPGFGLNEASFTLFVSLVISQGVLVVFYEGGKAWLYRRSLRVEAGLRLFPACILIALISVGISRAAGFQPGFVVGFIAAAVVLGAPDFSAKERGRAWAQVAAAMLAVSILAWLAAIPLHELYEASPSVWTSLPEATALAIFVVCLQGLLFNLIPLEFMDGWRIFKWNPLAWLALFVPSAFLFTQILFNEDDAYLDLIASQKSVTGALVLVGYLGVTFGTWAFLRWRVEQNEADPAVPVTGDAGG